MIFYAGGREDWAESHATWAMVKTPYKGVMSGSYRLLTQGLLDASRLYIRIFDHSSHGSGAVTSKKA